eukprot:TRINITY_DN69276_c0_g1_i1.p1 TRINITY_DN69276_c0_g1~~TRINITY_DN69276_c0_g1_i1.p1  ORF type:complete len:291 (-),score=32.77 TRINITY_DN69276_c0_g1_i1:95-967(-)
MDHALVLEVQILGMDGSHIASVTVDPTTCTGEELKRSVDFGPAKLSLVTADGKQVPDRKPLLEDPLGLLSSAFACQTVAPLIVTAVRMPHTDLSTLSIDCPAPAMGFATIADDIMHFSGQGDLNVWNGVRNGAPLAWQPAPEASAWTAEVACRISEDGGRAIVLFTVYDGPDGSGKLGFHFGPCTWHTHGVNVQSMNMQDWKVVDANPFEWQELRMCRRTGANGGGIFDFFCRPLQCESGAVQPEWICCGTGKAPSPFTDMSGSRIALGLKRQGQGRTNVEFKNFVVHAG